MTSVTDICNMALSEIRGGSINDIGELSTQARICKLKYPYARDMLLKAAPWQFAQRKRYLSELTDELYNWAYAYQYPSDCWHIDRISNGLEYVNSDNRTLANLHFDPSIIRPDLNAQVPYELINIDDNMVVGTNQPQAHIVYRAKITSTALFDPLFIQALVYLLASQLAVPIAGAEVGRGLRKENYQIYQAMLADALANNGNEQYRETPDSDLVTARL